MRRLVHGERGACRSWHLPAVGGSYCRRHRHSLAGCRGAGHRSGTSRVSESADMEQFGVTRSSMHSQGWQRCRVRRGSGWWAGPCFSCLHRVPDDAGKPLSNSDCTFTAILTACGKLGWEIDRAWDYVRSKIRAGGRQHLPRELQHMLQVRQNPRNSTTHIH